MNERNRTAVPDGNLPVLVDGVRTPFLDSAGLYADLMSYELGAKVLAGLLEKSSVPASDVELVIMGTVLHEVETTNVAREAMLAAGMNSRTPAYTVAMAGISPSVGVMNLCDQIALGRTGIGIASGTENFSDVPVRLSQKVRRSLMKLRQRKDFAERMKVLGSLRPWDLGLDIPDGSDYTTGMTMGVSCERMVKGFPVTREESDQFTAMSHANAVRAQNDGLLASQIVAVTNAAGETADTDNTPRADADIEKLSQLKPVFDRDSGIITPGNSSRFTDGAGALLLSSQSEAARRNLKPMAIVRDYLLGGVDSLEDEMLLGPAMTIPPLLARNGLGFDDIGAWEIHEAFAAQVLINLKCMQDPAFVRERHGEGMPVGHVPMERLNSWGGSLSLGNPFAATGCRLLLTAAQRLARENARYAVISTCAGGGLGAALLLENPAFA